MEYGEWAHGPFGLDAQRGQTVRYQRTVLAIVHTVTAGMRLGDVVPLLEGDRRVQVVFTHAPSALISSGVREYLCRLGGVVVPWQQATQMRFDLALAASDGLLEWVHAPVMKLPHGVRPSSNGSAIAAAIMLPTRSQVERLRRSCPAAAKTAIVAGDPCFDRIAASVPRRDAYRRALDVGERTLVVVSSTWGPASLLGRNPGLLAELAEELPPQRYQIAALIHPDVWGWHSPRQVRAWYEDSVQRGLLIIPPEEGWGAVLAAADVVVGDHGSTTCYAAGAGIPVLLASRGEGEVEPGSPAAALAEIAPGLRPPHVGAQRYAGQIDGAALAWHPEQHDQIRALVTDVPGRSVRLIRSVMYRLMELSEPDEPAPTRPVPAPRPLAAATAGDPR